MRILVVEDNVRLLDLVAGHLTDAGYIVDAVTTAGEFREFATAYPHAVYLIDLGLPDSEGISLIKEIRKRDAHTLILVATARAEIVDRVAALDAGADDYLVKPFHVEELLARTRALLRRPRMPAPQELRAGRLVLNCDTNEVFCREKSIDLRPSERRLLSLMMRRLGRLVARETIELTLEKLGSENSPNALEQLVSRLRRALVERSAGIRLRSVKGIGYVLEEHEFEKSA